MEDRILALEKRQLAILEELIATSPTGFNEEFLRLEGELKDQLAISTATPADRLAKITEPRVYVGPGESVPMSDLEPAEDVVFAPDAETEAIEALLAEEAKDE